MDGKTEASTADMEKKSTNDKKNDDKKDGPYTAHIKRMIALKIEAAQAMPEVVEKKRRYGK